MKKDLKCKVINQYGEDINVLCPTSGRMINDYLFNIKDEDNDLLSWYYHDVFKKLKYVYYDRNEKRLWLPKKDLYNLRKCKSLYNKKDYDGKCYIESLAFFKIGYLQSLLCINNTVEGMSGLMGDGATLW